MQKNKITDINLHSLLFILILCVGIQWSVRISCQETRNEKLRSLYGEMLRNCMHTQNMDSLYKEPKNPLSLDSKWVRNYENYISDAHALYDEWKKSTGYFKQNLLQYQNTTDLYNAIDTERSCRNINMKQKPLSSTIEGFHEKNNEYPECTETIKAIFTQSNIDSEKKNILYNNSDEMLVDYATVSMPLFGCVHNDITKWFASKAAYKIKNLDNNLYNKNILITESLSDLFILSPHVNRSMGFKEKEKILNAGAIVLTASRRKDDAACQAIWERPNLHYNDKDNICKRLGIMFRALDLLH